jgi:hypothetical protein
MSKKVAFLLLILTLKEGAFARHHGRRSSHRHHSNSSHETKNQNGTEDEKSATDGEAASPKTLEFKTVSCTTVEPLEGTGKFDLKSRVDGETEGGCPTKLYFYAGTEEYIIFSIAGASKLECFYTNLWDVNVHSPALASNTPVSVPKHFSCPKN